MPPSSPKRCRSSADRLLLNWGCSGALVAAAWFIGGCPNIGLVWTCCLHSGAVSSTPSIAYWSNMIKLTPEKIGFGTMIDRHHVINGLATPTTIPVNTLWLMAHCIHHKHPQNPFNPHPVSPSTPNFLRRPARSELLFHPASEGVPASEAWPWVFSLGL
jgi:hypothetical protein